MTSQRAIAQGGCARIYDAVFAGQRVALKVMSDSEEHAPQEVDAVRACAGCRCQRLPFTLCHPTRVTVVICLSPCRAALLPWLQLTFLTSRPHKNVLKLVGKPFNIGPRVCVPLEMCDGDLLAVASPTLTASRAGRETFARVFTQAVAGLLHCHAVGVYHLDVKPDNLLMVGDGVVKLADWGYAVLRGGSDVSSGRGRAGRRDRPATVGERLSTVAVAATECGTIEYAAPEALQASRANAAAKQQLKAQAVEERPRSRHGGGTGTTGRDASGLLGRVVNKCRAAVTSRASRGRVHPHDAVVDGSRPSAGAAALVSFDAEKADVWSLGITMVVVMTGYYPWRSAIPTDSRYSQWVSAWRKVGRVHPLTSPPGRPPLSSGGGGKPRTLAPVPLASSWDCESVGINSASPSSVSSRTSSPLQLFASFEHCRSPPMSPARGGCAASHEFFGPPLVGRARGGDAAASDRDATYSLATLLHRLTLANDRVIDDKAECSGRVDASQRSTLDTEPCRRALLQLIASMLNPDPAQRPDLLTVHHRLQGIAGVLGVADVEVVHLA